MKQIQIDAARHLATVQPGITGAELYSRLFKEGLTQVGGTCANVGVSGLVLTGGMGPLVRKHGLACDNLVSFELVDAEGKILHVSPDNEYKDLFWACCGAGGGNFGVVTSMLLKVYPAQQVTWFNIGWDWNQPVELVIAGWQDFMIHADRRWFSHLDLWAKPFPIEQFHKDLLPYTQGDYVGNPDSSLQDYLRDYYGDNVERLQCIKHKYDPHNVFQFEQSIQPFCEPQK